MIITDLNEQALTLAALHEARKIWLHTAAETGNPHAADAAAQARSLLERFDPEGLKKGRWS